MKTSPQSSELIQLLTDCFMKISPQWLELTTCDSGTPFNYMKIHIITVSCSPLYQRASCGTHIQQLVYTEKHAVLVCTEILQVTQTSAS